MCACIHKEKDRGEVEEKMLWGLVDKGVVWCVVSDV